MNINKRKNRLLKKIKNKKYRDAFVEESINIGLPFQIKALREQRKLTQIDFAKKSKMKQALISRLENPNYSSFSLSTLKKIAAIYDIGLVVKFVPVSDLVNWELNLNSESLKVLSYNEDPYFNLSEKKEGSTLRDKQRTIAFKSKSTSNTIDFLEYKEAKEKLIANSTMAYTENVQTEFAVLQY